jgi:hypothetical protein
MILEPISIATGGYIGIGPGTDYCPLPLAIGSDGYIRFEVTPPWPGDDPFGGGHGAVIRLPETYRRKEITEDEQLALLALFAIKEMDDV